jgi:hypothetical protein
MVLPGSYVYEGTNGPITGELLDIFRMRAIRSTTFRAAFTLQTRKVPDAYAAETDTFAAMAE